jgi:hypothetical protein
MFESSCIVNMAEFADGPQHTRRQALRFRELSASLSQGRDQSFVTPFQYKTLTRPGPEYIRMLFFEPQVFDLSTHV